MMDVTSWPETRELVVFWIWFAALVLIVLALVGTYIFEAMKRPRLDRHEPNGGLQQPNVPAWDFRPTDEPWRESDKRSSFAPPFSDSDATIPSVRDLRRSASKVPLEEIELQFQIPKKSHLPGRDTKTGTVHQLPNGNEVLLLRDGGSVRATAWRSFAALTGKRSEMERSDRHLERVALRWPLQAVPDRTGTLGGYESPKLDPKFMVNPRSSESRVRLLSDAFNDGSLAQDDRLELVKLLAQTLESFHSANVIHGNVVGETFGYSTNPIEIVVLDYSASRVYGNSPWSPPGPRQSEGRSRGDETSFDNDRRRFAKLAFRLIVGDSTHDSDGSSEDVIANLLGPRESRRLIWLWQRAAGRPGTMPTIAEWLRALEQS